MNADNDGQHIHLPSLRGKFMSLRAPTDKDIAAWFEWRQDVENLHTWSVFRRVVSLEEAAEEFRNMLHNSIVMMIMTNSAPNRPVGFVQAYSISQIDGYAHLLTFVSPRHAGPRVGAEASLRFSDYLFTYLNLRKLYAEVFDFNQASLSALTTGGFREEGCLKKHIYFAGRFWDQHKLALYAEDAELLRQRFATLLQSGSPEIVEVAINGKARNRL